ncbi:MAG: response regulator [Gammaproteobacteria bacterium]|nr:response regulator [Gammaproteobacteria bacterium]
MKSLSNSKATLTILAFGLAMMAVVRWQEQSALDAARASYRNESRERALDIATTVETNFNTIYSGLRTMARLPSVRTIDRYGRNFSADAHTTVQEIYNNLASQVSMSEVYIVPRDLNPDRVDPATGSLEAPIVTFDELIVGRSGGHRSHEDDELPEIEIFEYRLMRQQAQRLSSSFNNESRVDGLAYPALTGPEVVTCDNTRFDPAHPDDKDRSGLVYSVPFYDGEGAFAGLVSGVMLTAALRELLPDGFYALHNSANQYVAPASQPGPWREAAASIAADRPASDLIYSDVIKLKIADGSGHWTLWAGQPDSLFWSRSDVRAAHTVARTGYLVALLVTLLLLLWWRSQQAHRLHIERINQNLERTVDDRTSELRVALVAAEDAARAKSQFLANMSHEIRTPINGVLGMNEILLRTALDEHQKHCAQTIRDSGTALLGVVNDVLDFSKIEAGMLTLEQQSFDMRELGEDVASLLADSALAKGVTLHVVTPVHLNLWRSGDPARVRQVLTNLIGNAIKFTSQGSVVLRVDNGASDDLLRVTVTDSGIGIAPEDRERIFEAFAQADGGTARRYGGTGLGLSISARLVRLMDGEIGVDSTPGAGSTFWFTARLPLAAPQPASAEPLTLRVLLVDDHALDSEICRGYLASAGCEVESVVNVDAGVARLKAARFDAVIFGHYGNAEVALSALAQLQDKASATPPRKLLSAPLRNRPSHAQTREAGIDGLLVKPLRLRDVRNVLGNAERPATRVEGSLAALNFDGHVLLAEDNLVNQEVARALLEMAGLRVDTVPDGQAAVDAWAGGAYDLIFMDCQMPGMSGYDATAAIRERERLGKRAATPIVALTANSMHGDRERCLDAGMDDYLAKPFTDEQLRGMLKKWLGDTPAVATQEVTAPAVTAHVAASAAGREEAARDEAPLALLNPTALDAMRARERSGRGGLLRRVVDGYLQQSVEHLAMLAKGCVSRDGEAVVFAVHALKSSSAAIGAEQLAALCRGIEVEARGGDLDQACRELPQVTTLHGEVCALLNTHYRADAA